MTRQDWREMPWLLVLFGGWGLLFGVVLVIYEIVKGEYRA